MKTLAFVFSLIQVTSWADGKRDFLSCIKALNERGPTKGILIPLNDSGSDFVIKNVGGDTTTYTVTTANTEYAVYANQVKCTPHAGNTNLRALQIMYKNVMAHDSKISDDDKRAIAKGCSSVMMAPSSEVYPTETRH